MKSFFSLLTCAVVSVAITLTVVLFSGCGSIERQNYAITESSFSGKTFPFVYIDVDNGQEILSKEEYLPCSVRITNTDDEWVLDGENTQTANVKGRGNSSWAMPKKSYKLKFESKINLFGFGKAKKYNLIANYCDKSLSRNLMAYELARTIGLSETSSTQPVNLMVNNEYYGVYLLCEQNEIGKSRVNIESDLAKVNTGYLLEIDARANQEGVLGVDYFTIDGINYVLKDPESDDEGFTTEHFSFIQSYVQNCYNALNGSYEGVLDLIDVQSFAKCYLIHELFNTVDVGYSSFYIYKKGAKLYAGPVWDFDVSSGNCNYNAAANATNYMQAKIANVWYNKLTVFQDFKAIVKDLINDYYDIINEKIDDVVAYQMEYEDNNIANFEVWQIMGRYVWPNPIEIFDISTFSGQLEYLQNWLKAKLDYMKVVYCN